jgi:hypothetical protein
MQVNEEYTDCIVEMAGYGIGYWASKGEVGDNYTVTEVETGKVFVLTADDLSRARQRILDEAMVNKAVLGDLATGDPVDVDNVAADCVIQVACFGEIIYG